MKTDTFLVQFFTELYAAFHVLDVWVGADDEGLLEVHVELRHTDLVFVEKAERPDIEDRNTYSFVDQHATTITVTLPEGIEA